MFEGVRYISCGKFISSSEWTHQDRIIDSYEVIFVTKGWVYINEDGKNYALQANDVLILQPGIRHYGYQPSRETEFFWFHWKGSTTEPLTIKHRKIEDPYSISMYFRQLLQCRIEGKPPECFDYLARLILAELHFNSANPNVNHTAENIAAWIKANRHTAIKASQVAAHFGYNVDYLNRMFKASFLKPIKEYIDEERMKYIKSIMLTQNVSLNEVAMKAGFSDYKYFLKFFKYHEGITPTQFYKENAKVYINTR